MSSLWKYEILTLAGILLLKSKLLSQLLDMI